MTLSTRPYKGTRDFYPEEMRFRKWMFDKLRMVLERHGYEEYDGPMLEAFELYAAKSGEELVNRQLFWMMDQGERKLAVRPEMTPTLARMVAARLNELPKPIRWYSLPNLWRYERPQRGRLREHWQLNVDVLGGDSLLADAEILGVSVRLMEEFGGQENIRVRINHRQLMDHYFKTILGFSSEMALQVTKALDARDKIGAEAYEKWLRDLNVGQADQQKMEDFFQYSFSDLEKKIPCEGVEKLSQLFRYLEESGIRDQVDFDSSVLRGMDYYTGTVFEIYDVSPDNRRAMFGGGRYDDLIGLFGKNQLSGVGFGMGDVTFQHFLETHGLQPEIDFPLDAYVTLLRAEDRGVAEKVAQEIRSAGKKAVIALEFSPLKKQLKQANQLGASFAVILGEQELAEGKVLVKNLEGRTQESIELDRVKEFFNRA